MKPFFDIHCHLMTFDEPDFIMFLKHVSDNMSKEAFANMTSPDYLLDFKNKGMPTKVGNMINVMSHSQQQMAEMMERDLCGDYLKEAEQAFVKDGVFHFAKHTFDRYVICPMVMDFTNRNVLDNIHYTSRSPKDAFWYADKMLDSITHFYADNPASLLEIMPFAGINPPAYELEDIQQWLERYFSNYSPREHYQDQAKPHFFGIKLYPPLGFDPNPEDAEEQAKVELIYAYAEKYRIPITTHCDDGGYRITDVDVAHRNTSPEQWRGVLERHPHLKLNFAHFGRQYQRSHFIMKQVKWRDAIIDLALDYEGVFADLSFNGVSAEYYSALKAKLKSMNKDDRQRLTTCLMFGTDFMINLSKISSYHHYLKHYEASLLNEEDKLAFATTNCKCFLFE